MNSPLTITSRILTLVAEIAGETESEAAQAKRIFPKLWRRNRIRTIQANLAIKENTLTLEQVTALPEGKLRYYLDLALRAGFVDRTDPASPRSLRQKCRRTGQGMPSRGGRGR